MDGNRTHPGRLNSAPQTVLKTAGLASPIVRECTLEFDRWFAYSTVTHTRPEMSGTPAVSFAVNRSESGPPLDVKWGIDIYRAAVIACSITALSI
jgi:hypothetical protein